MKNVKFIKVACLLLLVVTLCLTILFVCTSISYTNTLKELTAINDSFTTTKDQLSDVEMNLLKEHQLVVDAKTEIVNLKDELSVSKTIIASLTDEAWQADLTVTETEINMLAKTVWGEARGCNKLEQSAVVWCVLNRVDAGQGSIAQVITAEDQFHGYSSTFPVTSEIKALVQDVVARWKLEKLTSAEVGRTLPSNYLFFRSDSTGIGNIFRTAWDGEYDVWNWDCWNPYTE